MNSQKTELQYIKGVGERRAELLKKLGVSDLDALFSYFPRSYEDWSHPLTVAEAPFDRPCCIRARVVTPIKEQFIRRNMTIYKFVAEDRDGASLFISVFNNRFIGNTVKQGGEYLFFGKADGNLVEKSMTSPVIRAVGYEKIRPIYRTTDGITSAAIEKIIGQALVGQSFPEYLPNSLIQKNGLISLTDAMHRIHFPENESQIAAARKRLAFDELLVLQTALLYTKGHHRESAAKPLARDLTENFAASLPYTLTDAQKRVIAECIRDMKSGIAMNRLVEGDVGSGKTAVAAALIDTVVQNGGQAAMMAPTEILAEQHYKTLQQLLSPRGIRVAQLIGGMTKKQKDEVKQKIAAGECDLLIGTHAILEDDVRFSDLNLVVTDEQHRFGVAQRTKLTEKGNGVHTLVMSATPIPRTLSLIIYGDLDLSILDQLPNGRKPIKTYCVDDSYRERIFAFLRKTMDAGRQCYIVCPAIEESDADLAAATAYYDKVCSEDFASYQVGLLHGKMKQKEKDAVMSYFASGKIQLLIATTVIEVGIDVPNATVMLIENAERFGLSQLHQLRGRIGRGSEQSTCILIAGGKEPTERLKVMTETSDGFRIADEDLKLRGPGDFIGSRQHGLPSLKIADLATDMDLLRGASKASTELLAADPKISAPEHTELRRKVAALLRQSVRYGYN